MESCSNCNEGLVEEQEHNSEVLLVCMSCGTSVVAKEAMLKNPKEAGYPENCMVGRHDFTDRMSQGTRQRKDLRKVFRATMSQVLTGPYS